MIFTLALCLAVMAAATAAQPGAESEVFNDEDMMEMAKVNQTLVVFKRKHTRETPFRCLSAANEKQYSTTQYQYKLGAKLGKTYHSHTVNVTLEKLDDSISGYKSTYTYNGTVYTLTMKKVGPMRECFVIFVNKSDGKQGCELLVTASKVNDPIPEECQNYYSKNCNGTNIRLHNRNCVYNTVS
uniref:Putative secreted protein n=1 Tax=Amblyomma cajennense TaxID=34607 RepID=A0A023FQK7_AMBCJ